jgi:hypothetical protein
MVRQLTGKAASTSNSTTNKMSACLIFTLYECNLATVAIFPQPLARRSDRRIAKMAILVFAEREKEREECEAFTLDVSAQGARIVTGISLTPGQVVQVVPADGSDPVTGRVVWVGKPASEVEGQAGLEFFGPFDVPT